MMIRNDRSNEDDDRNDRSMVNIEIHKLKIIS